MIMTDCLYKNIISLLDIQLFVKNLNYIRDGHINMFSTFFSDHVHGV
jgi:hypothetical protein